MLIVKVPGINGLGKTQGCEGAGNALIESLKNIYSNEQGKQVNVKELDLEEIHLDNFNLDLTNKLIYKNAFESFYKERVIFLGGDHSISYSLTRAFLDFCQHNGKEPCLIVFDAHPDLMQPSSEFPTHEEWLRKLIEDGFPVENVLLIGIRNSDIEEVKFMNEKKMKIISVNQIQGNLQDIADAITEFANRKELYVSIDIDAVDPAFAPSTGYAEVGGLTSREIIYLIQRLNKVKTLKAVDIVEINPEKDSEIDKSISDSKTFKEKQKVSDKNKDNLTVKLGAKILSEFL